MDRPFYISSSEIPPDEQVWSDLYDWLLTLVEHWVHFSHVRSWQGQLSEVAEEITQEALLRTFRYNQRAERGEAPPVVSLRSLSKVIAQNHFRDRRKKDQRLISQTDFSTGEEVEKHMVIDPAQVAVDELILQSTIRMAAQIISNLPNQQQTALLTDLANITDFTAEPGLLEQTLSENDIQLYDYKQPLPSTPAERSRHASHLCIAYKRLRQKVHEQ